jgi:hypothetical protein
MSAKRHACKDCKRFYSFKTNLNQEVCVVELDDYGFDPITGPVRLTQNFNCAQQNRQGDCKYFKPSLKARFWQCMGGRI